MTAAFEAASTTKGWQAKQRIVEEMLVVPTPCTLHVESLLVLLPPLT
jgi:hypothetical protein